jgi:hypothetical protein
MKAIDFRNATFHSLHSELEGLRLRVYEAWIKYGPCTTRALAEHCGIDLLTVRPRTTELLQLGLLEVVTEPYEVTHDIEDGYGQTAIQATVTINPPPGEGTYRATLQEQWNLWREGVINNQMQLI